MATTAVTRSVVALWRMPEPRRTRVMSSASGPREISTTAWLLRPRYYEIRFEEVVELVLGYERCLDCHVLGVVEVLAGLSGLGEGYLRSLDAECGGSGQDAVCCPPFVLVALDVAEAALDAVHSALDVGDVLSEQDELSG